MSSADQHADETNQPVVIEIDELAQFTEGLDAAGREMSNVGFSQSLREIFELARAHPIGISTVLSTPFSNDAGC
jgi:hypothetical protein